MHRKIEVKTRYIAAGLFGHRFALIACTFVCVMCGMNGAYAQMGNGSSINAFSPYTMYGLGELLPSGSAEYRSMGDIGVAVREGVTFNYANPASLSAIPQRSALMNMGAEARNMYGRSVSGGMRSSTSRNSVNLHDLGFAFPLARGVGFGVGLTPVTAVGYRSSIVSTNQDVVENIGKVVYSYMGDGGISQLQAGVGVRLSRGLSLGINGHYYFGTINRYYNADMYSYLNSDSYRSVGTTEKSTISRFLVSVGAQYMFRVGKAASFTIGGTYQPRARTTVRQNATTFSYVGAIRDTVGSRESSYSMDIPARLAVGVHYQGPKVGFGVDYVRQDWRRADGVLNADALAVGINLQTYQEIRVGLSVTPNRLAMTNFLNRWTYKIGGRYGTGYMGDNGTTRDEMALSLGIEIPMRRGSMSRVSVGGEIGQRGSVTKNLVQDRFWRVFVGVTLFGDDMWFTKVKFD